MSEETLTLTRMYDIAISWRQQTIIPRVLVTLCYVACQLKSMLSPQVLANAVVWLVTGRGTANSRQCNTITVAELGT